MKTIADPAVLEGLVARLETLEPDTPRQWGTMTPAEMLCHLGDATESVLEQGSTEDAEAPRGRPVMKWIALRSPLSWPKGVKTLPDFDPHAGGTKPGELQADRQRVISALRALAAAPAGELATSHRMFGTMSQRDWHIWAYRHFDHHLRQFGL